MSQMDPMQGQAPWPDSPPRQGMSGATKVFLFLGVGCGGVLLLCCGGLVGVSYMVGRMAEESAVKDPAEVQAMADSIATLDAPPSLKPQVGFDFTVPFINERIVKAAIFIADEQNPDDQPKGMLLLAEWFPEPYQNKDPEEVSAEMDAWFEGQEGWDANRRQNVLESEDVEVTVRDQPARFVVQRVEDRESGKEFVQAIGTFAAEEGTGFMMLMLEAEQYSMEQVKEIVQTVK